jgi:hypothetical protein
LTQKSAAAVSQGQRGRHDRLDGWCLLHIDCIMLQIDPPPYRRVALPGLCPKYPQTLNPTLTFIVPCFCATFAASPLQGPEAADAVSSSSSSKPGAAGAARPTGRVVAVTKRNWRTRCVLTDSVRGVDMQTISMAPSVFWGWGADAEWGWGNVLGRPLPSEVGVGGM